MREVIVHLNVEVADDDDRSAAAIADAISDALAAVQVKSAVGAAAGAERLRGLRILVPLAEEV